MDKIVLVDLPEVATIEKNLALIDQKSEGVEKPH